MSIETIIAKWRETADALDKSFTPGGMVMAAERRNCADELEAACADQLSACRTEEAVAWQMRSIDPADCDFNEWKPCSRLSDDSKQALGFRYEFRDLYAHPAKAVPEGDSQLSAVELAALERILKDRASPYLNTDFMDRAEFEIVLADFDIIHAALRRLAHPAPVAAALTTPERKDCDVCKGSGMVCTGSTMTEVGQEPHLEPCDNCDHGKVW